MEILAGLALVLTRLIEVLLVEALRSAPAKLIAKGAPAPKFAAEEVLRKTEQVFTRTKTESTLEFPCDHPLPKGVCRLKEHRQPVSGATR